MNRIKKFSQFVNEDYSFSDLIDKGKSFMGKISGWVKSVFDRFSGKIIQQGPNAGLPAVAYFQDGKDGKNVADQVAAYLSSKGTSESYDQAELEEGREFLEYGPGGIDNVNAEELQQLLVQRFKSLTMAGKPIIGPDGTERVSRGAGTPIFIYGAPGIGKTQIVAQAASSLGVGLMFADLENAEPTDLRGVPSVVEVPSDSPIGKGVTRENQPDWFPTDNGPDDKGGIFFFDELNRADSPVLKSMLKLADNRRIANYELPSKWLLVAAGNRPKDEAEMSEITKLSTALKRRFEIINFVPESSGLIKHIRTSTKQEEEGLGYTLSEIVLPELIAFFDSGIGEEYFHDLDPNNDQEIYASPASWLKASSVLFSRIKMIEAEEGPDAKIGSTEVEGIFRKAVGKSAASAFMKFYFISQNLNYNDIIKVFTEPNKAPMPPRNKAGDAYIPDDTHATLAAIIIKSKELTLTPENFGHAIDYTIRLNSPEYAAAFMSRLIDTHPYIKKNTEMMKQLAKYHAKYVAPLDFEDDI
jgi:hypothetical protein